MKIEKYLQDQYKWGYFRVSKISIKDFDKKHLKKTFEKYPMFLIGYELGVKGDNPHIQGVIAMSEFDEKEIQDLCKKAFDKPTAHNMYMRVQSVIDRKSAIKYNLKEGNFVYKGFSKEFITQMQKCAVKKEMYQKKMTEIEDKVISKEISFNKYMTSYIQIKCDHNYPIYDNHVEAKFNTMLIRSEKMDAETYCRTKYEKYYDNY